MLEAVSRAPDLDRGVSRYLAQGIETVRNLREWNQHSLHNDYVAACQREKLLTMGRTGSLEPAEAEHKARATYSREVVRVGFRSQICLGHREGVGGHCSSIYPSAPIHPPGLSVRILRLTRLPTSSKGARASC